MSYYSLLTATADKHTQVEPFVIKQDAMAPIGLDECAWSAFRGTSVDEHGNIDMEEYLNHYDKDATLAFMQMLSKRITNGRITVSFTPEDGGVSTVYVVEKEGFVRFDDCEDPNALDFKNAYCCGGPRGELVARALIHESVHAMRQRINELLSIDLQLSGDAA